MKKWVLLFFIYGCWIYTFGQTVWQTNLEGTWKVEKYDQYERWDQLNEQRWKGFSYGYQTDKMYVMEYLELSKNGEKLDYSATVIGQNEGKTISFVGAPTDSSFVVSNLKHDFPQRIEYVFLNAKTIRVTISGGEKKPFTYLLLKQ